MCTVRVDEAGKERRRADDERGGGDEAFPDE